MSLLKTRAEATNLGIQISFTKHLFLINTHNLLNKNTLDGGLRDAKMA